MSNNTVIQYRRTIPKTTRHLDNKAPRNCLETLGLAKIPRHIFICVDQTVANCCSKQASLESWEYLKKRRKKLKLYQSHNSRPICVYELKPIACGFLVLDR